MNAPDQIAAEPGRHGREALGVQETRQEPGGATLADAAHSLRQHVDQRWVQIADGVLLKALSATRRSLPVRAHSDTGRITVSQQVIIAHVRDAVADIPAAAPTRVHVRADEGHHFSGLTVEVTVQYGHMVLDLADEIRARAETALRQLLGPARVPVTVTAMHVHVSDVTTDDPHTGRPPD